MLSGYNDFEADVRSIFGDVIDQYGFRTISTEYDAVVLENDKVELVFSIIEDDMNMSIKSAGQYYAVADIARLADPAFYAGWVAQRKAACGQLHRDGYYKCYLQHYKILSDTFLTHTYATGAVLMQEANSQLADEKQVYNDRFSRAWQAMQQLPYEHPIRQKYIHDDPTWIDDMIASLDR